MSDSFLCSVCNACRFESVEELEHHERACDGLYKEIFTCDVCRRAQFETMEEAEAHEAVCGTFPNRIPDENTEDLENDNDEEKSVFKEVFTCDVCRVANFDTVEEAEAHEANCKSTNADDENDEELKQGEETFNGVFVEVFTCDVCRKAQFETMEEAEAHEAKCKSRADENNEELKKGEEASNGVFVEVFTCDVCRVANFDTMEEAEVHEANCKSTGADENTEQLENGSDDAGKCDGLFKEVFTCDVCRVANFDTMEEAEAHEAKCNVLVEPSTGQQITEFTFDPNQSSGDFSDLSLAEEYDTNGVIEQAAKHQVNKCLKQQGHTVIVVIPPGRIGLNLKLDKEMGGAIVTKVDEHSTTGGQIHAGDRIISIDGNKIFTIADYAINQGKTRTLEVVTKTPRKIIRKPLKHALFTQSIHNKSASNDPLPGLGAPSDNNHSSKIYTPSGVLNNSRAEHNHSNQEKKHISISDYLRPVEVPFDPLDEKFDNSIERELAWIIEESSIIQPQLAQNSFILDYAWRHSSLSLRSAIHKTFPRAVSSVMKNMKVDMTDQEIRDKYCNEGCVTILDADSLVLNKQKLGHLRGDIHRVVFNFRFRRSPCIERELNLILKERVEDPDEDVAPPRRRHSRRRKRLLNDDLIMTADEVNLSLQSTAKTPDEISSLATNKPSAISELEDEVAFLVEESLLLLPEHMLVGSADPQKIITSVVSAGLSTQHDDGINWNYVCDNASEQLKKVIEEKGIKRRPLRRIIRYHEIDVRIAFERRRVEICELLVLHGYRREQTRMNLPSKELLEQVGLLNVMKVRLKYRLRTSGLSQHASEKELRSACNVRSKKKQRVQPTKKPIALDFTKVNPNRCAILNQTERELAWLREEFEMEYDHGCFDWDYIEKRSSQQMKLIMTYAKVAPISENPSVVGVSKLKKLVRLDCVGVKQAFTELRRDIRYALNVGFKRDLRRNHLPDLPPAPVNHVSRGKYVTDVEHPQRDSGDPTINSPTNNLLRGEWKIDKDSWCSGPR